MQVTEGAIVLGLRSRPGLKHPPSRCTKITGDRFRIENRHGSFWFTSTDNERCMSLRSFLMSL